MNNKKGTSDNFVINGGPQLYEPKSNQSIGYEIFRSLNLYKSKIAQITPETGLTNTFEEILSRAVRVSLNIQKMGLKPNDIFCSIDDNHEYHSIPLIVAQFLGKPFTALDPSLPIDDLKYLLELLEPTYLFLGQNYVQKIEKCLQELNWKCVIIVSGETSKHIQFRDLIKPIAGENEFKPLPVKSNKETAFIFFSSGTTGKPKGVCCSHYGLLSSIVNWFQCWNLGNQLNLSDYTHKLRDGPDCVQFITSPLYWISGGVITLTTFLTGSTKIVVKEFDPLDTWKILEKYKVNSAMLQTAEATDFYKFGRPEDIDTSHLQELKTGGGRVSILLMESLIKVLPGTTVFNAYGQTEANGPLAAFGPENYHLQREKLSSCGKPMPGFLYKIVDVETSKPVGLNKEGELRVKAKFLMTGYFKKDVSDLYDSEGYLRTGDIAYFDDDLCLHIVDRLKDIIKYVLYDVSPSKIENVLSRHPAVEEGVVIGYPHDEDGERPMALVVLKKGYEKVTSEEIQKFVDDRVDSETHRLTGGVAFINSILKTSTGKVKKLAMKKMVISGEKWD